MLILLLVYALCVSRKWYCIAVSSANLPLFVQFTFEQIKHWLCSWTQVGIAVLITVNMKKLIESCLPHGEDLGPEKPLVILQRTYSVKVVFSYVVFRE